MSCPICQKRKAGRFCPAKAEKICAVCCGSEREITLDCPESCPYLQQARTHEPTRSQEELAGEELFLDVDAGQRFYYEREPLIAGLLTTVISSGRRIATTGRYRPYPIAGAVLAGAGMFLLSRLGLHTSHLTSSLYMIVLGLGIGLIMQVMVLVAQNSASYADLGAATGAVNLARQVGSSVGVALIGALFIKRLHERLTQGLPQAAASHAATAITSVTPQALSRLPAAFQLAIKTAFASALPPIYIYLVPLVAVAFVLALILPERTLRTRAFTAMDGGSGDSLTEVSAG